ncbi:MAG: anion permease [Chromatiales bacterium]|nr:anion permease [Chromatiales bacterium]
MQAIEASETQPLLRLPIFEDANRRALARMVPKLSERSYAAGELLFTFGEPAETLYFIRSGQVEMRSGRRCTDTIETGFTGEEAAVGAHRYLAEAICTEPTEVYTFPAEAVRELLDCSPGIRGQFYQSLINHCTDQHPFELGPHGRAQDDDKDNHIHSVGSALGWLLALVAPALVYWLSMENSDLPWASVNFLTIFSAAVVMWVFRLVPEYIPALFIVMAVIVLGLVPNDVILSGYASGSFFMALSVFGIGAVLVQSGFTYRLALWILRATPPSSFWYNQAMFLVGFLLTPILPSANGRSALVAPLLTDILGVLGYRRGGRAATAMAAAAFIGISLFSASFLTAKSVNFALFGLFPSQVKDQFTWGYWVFTSLVATGVLLVLYLLLAEVFFRRSEKANLSQDHLAAQLQIIGPMSGREWTAVAGVALFILGVMTSSLHKIAPPWIGLAILYILLTVGSISKKGFRTQIDWPFLLMLGGFVGLVKAMSYLGIDAWFAGHLAWVGNFMSGNFYLFSALLGVVIFVVRLVVPNSAAIILLASIFMPVAAAQGINPWVIAFIVILFSDGWFMPYQCSYYLLLVSRTEHDNLFDQRSLLHFTMITNLFRFAAVFASIPFWQYLGLL